MNKMVLPGLVGSRTINAGTVLDDKNGTLSWSIRENPISYPARHGFTGRTPRRFLRASNGRKTGEARECVRCFGGAGVKAACAHTVCDLRDLRRFPAISGPRACNLRKNPGKKRARHQADAQTIDPTRRCAHVSAQEPETTPAPQPGCWEKPGWGRPTCWRWYPPVPPTGGPRGEAGLGTPDLLEALIGRARAGEPFDPRGPPSPIPGMSLHGSGGVKGVVEVGCPSSSEQPDDEPSAKRPW